MRISGQETFLAGTYYYAFLYGAVSFILVLMALFLLYVICSKRYRLNWFEKDLLEKAKNGDFKTRYGSTFTHHLTREIYRSFFSSQDALCGILTKSDAGSNRSLHDSSAVDKFWVPGKKTGD